MRIEQLVSAESGWRAVFAEPDGSESLSRILGWAVQSGADGTEVVGLIVDPGEPSRVIAAPGATSPEGGGFARYRYVPPPKPEPVPPPAPPAASEAEAQPAKGVLKRRR